MTGPGGGAPVLTVVKGEERTSWFKLLHPGLFLYHCAAPPVMDHIANGMYGLILVEPKEGLPPVDREYYVMQGEFYTAGKYGEEGLQPFDLDKAVDEKPSYVVFNGAVGAIAGDKALTANVGEKIRIYIGNGGPNLTCSFHLIGVIFDTVYPEGGTAPTHNVQTTVVPPGGAAIVEFTARVPGTFVLVDHALFRAFNKGAVGMLKVEGREDHLVYSGKEHDTIYAGAPFENVAVTPVRTEPQPALAAQAKAVPPGFDPASHTQYEHGRQVYMQTCFVCHQPNGLGVPDQIPPLAKSDVLLADKAGAIRGVLQGRSGEITVNGRKYNATMVPLAYLNDQQIADALTYVFNSWGNSGEPVTAAEVLEIRRGTPVLAANPME